MDVPPGVLHRASRDDRPADQTDILYAATFTRAAHNSFNVGTQTVGGVEVLQQLDGSEKNTYSTYRT